MNANFNASGTIHQILWLGDELSGTNREDQEQRDWQDLVLVISSKRHHGSLNVHSYLCLHALLHYLQLDSWTA